MEWAHQSPRFWFGDRHAAAVEIFISPLQGRGELWRELGDGDVRKAAYRGG